MTCISVYPNVKYRVHLKSGSTRINEAAKIGVPKFQKFLPIRYVSFVCLKTKVLKYQNGFLLQNRPIKGGVGG